MDKRGQNRGTVYCRRDGRWEGAITLPGTGGRRQALLRGDGGAGRAAAGGPRRGGRGRRGRGPRVADGRRLPRLVAGGRRQAGQAGEHPPLIRKPRPPAPPPHARAVLALYPSEGAWGDAPRRRGRLAGRPPRAPPPSARACGCSGRGKGTPAPGDRPQLCGGPSPAVHGGPHGAAARPNRPPSAAVDGCGSGWGATFCYRFATAGRGPAILGTIARHVRPVLVRGVVAAASTPRVDDTSRPQ